MLLEEIISYLPSYLIIILLIFNKVNTSIVIKTSLLLYI